MSNNELLDLIAKGETEKLLLQKNFTRRLNSLAASGLVEICEGKIFVTHKGERLQKKKRIQQVERTKVQKEMKEFSRSSFRRNSIYVYLCLILLCTTAIYLSIIIMQGQ